jgi:hypothetical protein
LQIPQRFEKAYFSHLFDVHRASDIRHIEIYTVEFAYTSVEAEIVISDFRKDEASGNDEIPAKVSQVGGEVLLSEIHKLIN